MFGYPNGHSSSRRNSEDFHEDAASRREETNASNPWWDDMQAWNAALWRAAIMRNALNAASMNDHTQLPFVPSSSNDDGDPTQQSTLLILCNGHQESNAINFQSRDVFVCKMPVHLKDGHPIRVSIGDSAYEVIPTAAKAVVCQSPNQKHATSPTPPADQSGQSQINSIFGTPIHDQSMSSSSLPSPKLPIDIQYRNYARFLHSQRSWLPIGTHMTKSIHQKSTPAFSYTRKRTKCVQHKFHMRRKREISIAKVVTQNSDAVKSPVNEPSSTGLSEESIANISTPSSIDGVDLEEIKRFAKLFKMKRLSLGLTQTQVGQTLSLTNGPAYSQSAICRFEKLDITPKSAQKIKPVLERWLQEVDDQLKINGPMAVQKPSPHPRPESKSDHPDTIALVAQCRTRSETCSNEKSMDDTTDAGSDDHAIDHASNCKRRKRRTSFTPQALELLNEYFENNSHPSGTEMTSLAERLNYEREVIRVWFCNKRQALKNTFKKLKAS